MRFDEFGQWDLDPLNEDLRKWFREKWVRFGPDGRIRGECARGDEGEGKPKCLPQAQAHALGKKGRKYAASKKRREDPNPERSGRAINVATKKKKKVKEDQSLREGVNDPHIFKAIAMIGPPGAGKSTVAQRLIGGSGLRNLNIDNFNELLIKKGQVPGGNLTQAQMNRNWELTQKQKTNWIDGRLGLLIDGTGRNLDDITGPLSELEALGYDTMVIFVTVSLETSISRQQSRAAKQAAQYGAGRNVPLDYAKQSYQQIQANVPRMKELFGNRLLVINNEGDVNLDREQKIINRFLSTPPSKPPALQWIQSQTSSQTNPNQNVAEQQITEAREADLYHGTTILAAERILKSNMFKADAAVEPHIQHLLKKHSDTAKTVSFSRNFATAQGFTASVGDNRVQGVIFVIDQDRLYRDLGRRVVPYNDLAGIPGRDAKKTENEEAVFGDIEDADQYIKEIIVLVSPGWYDRLDELDIGGRYPLVAANPRTRYLPRLLRRGADSSRPSYALGARGQFYGRQELERRAEKTQSQSPEQLDELKCWTGYERVPGKKAGTPGSCRKRTNEEHEVAPLDDETVRRITVRLLQYWEERDLKNINVRQSGDDSFRVTGSYPFGESIEVEYEFDRLSRKIRYVDKRIVSVKNEGLTVDSETYNPNLPPSSIDSKTGREADEYTVRPKPMSVPYMPTVPDTKEPPRIPSVPEPGKGIKKITESKCPECGGSAYSDRMLAEKRDACYHKVRSRYRVWPSAYASGALVQCRKKGAKNWGNKKK